jgi:hypothetical protein
MQFSKREIQKEKQIAGYAVTKLDRLDDFLHIA